MEKEKHVSIHEPPVIVAAGFFGATKKDKIETQPTHEESDSGEGSSSSGEGSSEEGTPIQEERKPSWAWPKLHEVTEDAKKRSSPVPPLQEVPIHATKGSSASPHIQEFPVDSKKRSSAHDKKRSSAAPPIQEVPIPATKGSSASPHLQEFPVDSKKRSSAHAKKRSSAGHKLREVPIHATKGSSASPHLQEFPLEEGDSEEDDEEEDDEEDDEEVHDEGDDEDDEEDDDETGTPSPPITKAPTHVPTALNVPTHAATIRNVPTHAPAIRKAPTPTQVKSAAPTYVTAKLPPPTIKTYTDKLDYLQGNFFNLAEQQEKLLETRQLLFGDLIQFCPPPEKCNCEEEWKKKWEEQHKLISTCKCGKDKCGCECCGCPRPSTRLTYYKKKSPSDRKSRSRSVSKKNDKAHDKTNTHHLKKGNSIGCFALTNIEQDQTQIKAREEVMDKINNNICQAQVQGMTSKKEEKPKGKGFLEELLSAPFGGMQMNMREKSTALTFVAGSRLSKSNSDEEEEDSDEDDDSDSTEKRKSGQAHPRASTNHKAPANHQPSRASTHHKAPDHNRASTHKAPGQHPAPSRASTHHKAPGHHHAPAHPKTPGHQQSNINLNIITGAAGQCKPKGPPMCKPKPKPHPKKKKKHGRRKSRGRSRSRATTAESDSSDSSCCSDACDDDFPADFLMFILTMNSTANYYKCNSSYQASYYRAQLEQEQALNRRQQEVEAERAANVSRLDVECLQEIIKSQGEGVLYNKEVAITLRSFNPKDPRCPVSENPLIDLHSLKLFANGEKETECCCVEPTTKDQCTSPNISDNDEEDDEDEDEEDDHCQLNAKHHDKCEKGTCCPIAPPPPPPCCCDENNKAIAARDAIMPRCNLYSGGRYGGSVGRSIPPLANSCVPYCPPQMSYPNSGCATPLPPPYCMPQSPYCPPQMCCPSPPPYCYSPPAPCMGGYNYTCYPCFAPSPPPCYPYCYPCYPPCGPPPCGPPPCGDDEEEECDEDEEEECPDLDLSFCDEGHSMETEGCRTSDGSGNPQVNWGRGQDETTSIRDSYFNGYGGGTHPHPMMTQTSRPFPFHQSENLQVGSGHVSAAPSRRSQMGHPHPFQNPMAMANGRLFPERERGCDPKEECYYDKNGKLKCKRKGNFKRIRYVPCPVKRRRKFKRYVTN